MTLDQTQPQSTESRVQSQELSRERPGPPRHVPGYEPRKFLGAGAYGEVWVALDQNTGRRVAIKFFLNQSGIDWSNLSREVEKLVFLSADRYVVQLLDVGWNSDPPYYVMEYIENGSLDDYLQRRGALPVGEAVEIFREVAFGLSRAHGKGVLHCDLKPANILLDQDNKPRLADFGQSRLAHEQAPALGTLFFMAPEQADLHAVADARWDVYALGALLHCMLTGQPPHRTDQAISQIDSATDLTARLTNYRELIESAPPSSHVREIRGIDRPLLEILDRCLAVDPERRYPNVQSVIDAIESRDMLRDRKPLIILGLVGPLLFLLVTMLFGWRSHQRAVGDADRLLLQRTQVSNGFAADFVSEAVARRIESYFRAVQREASDDKFRRQLDELVREADSVLEQRKGKTPNADPTSRDRLLKHPLRQPLQARMEQLLNDPLRPEIASWFVTDHRGVHVAAAFDTPAETSIAGDFSYRTYFHGGAKGIRSVDGRIIETTHLSAVFQSTATNAWKVAISTPISDQDGRFQGVVALTVELGRLGELLGGESGLSQFNVLIDGRQGDNRGVILQHPLFERLLKQQRNLDAEFSTSPRYRVPLDTMRDGEIYLDPLGQHDDGEDFRQNWIAAVRPVRLAPTDSHGSSAARGEQDTGLVVLVQEDYDLAASAVHQLGDSLLKQSILALSSVVLLVVALWYSVAKAMGDPNDAVRRHGGLRAAPTTIHNMETIELPHPLRRNN
jgi:serine/threonine protein kinase